MVLRLYEDMNSNTARLDSTWPLLGAIAMDKLREDAYAPPTISSSSSYTAGRSASKFGSGTGDILLRMGRRVSHAFNFRTAYNKVNEE